MGILVSRAKNQKKLRKNGGLAENRYFIFLQQFKPILIPMLCFLYFVAFESISFGIDSVSQDKFGKKAFYISLVKNIRNISFFLNFLN